MKKTSALLCAAILSCLFTDNVSAAERKQAANTTVDIPESRNQIIKLTDKGLSPETLKMKVEDSIVFFLNDTDDALTSLEIEFGEKSTHCGGAKMQTGKNGKVASVRPFGPNDFTSTCFHEPGVYPFTVYGLKANPDGVKSKIFVE